MFKIKSLGVLFALIVGLGLTLTVLWGLGGVHVIYAATITVNSTDDENNTDGDCSLREAIAAANTDAAVDGCGPGVGADTIQFSLTTPAIITLTLGQLTINSDPLTLDGPGASLLAISGDDAARIFDVTNAVTLSGMTVRDGNATGAGGGLRSAGPTTLIGVVFLYNTAAAAGGAIDVQGNLTMSDTDVLSNTAAGDGGGVNSFGALTRVSGGRFENNHAGNVAGGLYANGALVLSGTHFISNSAQTYAGGAWIWQSATVTNARFERNSAQNNDIGALYVRYDLLVTGSSFFSNTAQRHYGAVWTGGDAHLTDGAFTSNVAGTGRSGALDVDGALWLTRTHFVANQAATSGGAIGVQGDLRMSGSDVLSNTAGGQGGGINGYGALAQISGGHFGNNRAGSAAGGLYAGGALILNGTQFISNTAGGDYGAARAGGDTFVAGGVFTANVAGTGRAGALDVGGALWLTGTHFYGNRAATSGGALVHAGSDGRLVNALFARNQASGDGGAMFLDHSGGLEIVHATIVAPMSPLGEAISVNASGRVTVTNTIVAGYLNALTVEAGDVYEDYNLFYQTVPISGSVVRGGHSLSGDPAFADPAHDDYHLSAASAALNTGADAGVAADADGDPRPGGSGVDIGYDETTHVSDVAVAKTVHTDPGPGAPITYTISFSNVRSALLPGVFITDVIPACLYGLNVVSSGVLITDTGASPPFVWQVRDLAAGQGGVITVTGVLTDPLARGTFTNTVEIHTAASESDTSNNTAAAGTTVPNVAPVAVNDTFTTAEDVAASLSPLANDVDGDPLYVAALSQPTHGTTAFSGTTHVVYTPTLDFNGSDVFTYTTSDGELFDTAAVTISVTPANDAPVIAGGEIASATMSEDGDPTPFQLTLDASDVDGDALTWSIVTPPAHGPATIAPGPAISATVAYTPTADYNGTDAFTVQVSDGALTDTVLVNVAVAPVNDAPVAVDDVAVALRDRGGDITILAASGAGLDVLANDTDLEGDSLAIAAVGIPDQGGRLVGPGGSLVVYTPTATFTGTETFTYTVTDGGLTDTATVSVTVVNGAGGGVAGDTFVVPNTGAGSAFTVTIEIPVGVVDAGHFALVYDERAGANGPSPRGFEAAGAFFKLAAYLEGQLLADDHVFQQPLTLTLEYGHAGVAGIGPSERTLALYSWDEGDWSDGGITIVERDVTRHRLVVTLSHPTEFGLFRRGFFYLPLVCSI